MATEPSHRRLITGPDAAELRRQLGATSWVVLEEMMERSTDPRSDLRSAVSIRAMASSLGLAKNTVARAVRRLRDAGVIVADQTRAESGTFEAGSYRLTVPASCLSVALPSQPPVAPSAGRPSSVRRSSGQLSLSLEV